MPKAQSQLNLPRRVSLLHLAFCSAAVLGLFAGWVFTSYQQASEQVITSGLALIDRTNRSLEIDRLRFEAANQQSIVERIGQDNRLQYCIIMGVDGEAHAHSDPAQVGKPSQELDGRFEERGEVLIVRAPAEATIELRRHLTIGDSVVGHLRMGFEHPKLSNHVINSISHAPSAIVIPAVLIVVGVFVIRKIVTPIANVEQQLRTVCSATSIEEVTLTQVPVNSGCSLGWNRVVEYLDGSRQPLLDRLSSTFEPQNEGASRGGH